MIIIIDGYNVIKSLVPGEIDEQERRAFLNMLRKYAHKKHHQILVVFDAGPYEWEFKEEINGIKVIYSGRFKTADKCIMHYLSKHHTHETLVVSSDNEIARHASKLDIPSIGAQDFLFLVQEADRENSAIAAQEVSVALETDTQDLDIIMQEGSRKVPIKQEDISASSTGPSKKMSRIEKKLYAILKKL